MTAPRPLRVTDTGWATMRAARRRARSAAASLTGGGSGPGLRTMLAGRRRISSRSASGSTPKPALPGTTLYNAAFFAGLQLDSHTPHQFWISRYPKGREATVSFGGPELVFTNDWDAGLLINAYAGSNGITIRFFSSPLGRRVETETGETRDVVQPTVKETVNPDLEPGARVVEQNMGGAGFTVSYTRKVWAGDTLRSEQTFTWTYDPQNAYVEIGPPEKKPSTTTAPDGATTAPGGQTTAPEEQPAPAPSRTRTATPGAAAPPP